MATESEREGRCAWLDRVEPFLDGRLPSDRDREFQQHLEHCPTCQAELGALREVQAALRLAASRPLPALDRDALARSIFERPQCRSFWTALGSRPALALPAAALVVVLAVVCLVIYSAGEFTIGTHRPSPVQPAGVESPSQPLRAPAEGAVVSYVEGQVSGPRAGTGGLELAIGRPVRVGSASALAVRLDPDSSLTVLADSQVQVDWDGGWRVQLNSGGLVARLRPGRPHRFRVRCQAGMLEAVGTSFSMDRLVDGSFDVRLAHGELIWTSWQGGSGRVHAPLRGRFHAAGFDTTRSDLGSEGPLAFAERIDPFLDGSLGSLRLSSEPVPAQVRIDGQQMGQTPLVVARPEGAHQVELRATGFEPQQLAVVLTRDQWVDRTIELRSLPASLPKNQLDPLRQARALLAARKLAAAEALLTSHLRAQPEDARGWLLLADGQRLGGQPAAALDTYLKAARLADDARLAEVASYQAGLLQLNSLDRAVAALATFEALRREHPQGLLRQEVAFHLTECYLATGDYPRALRALRDYLRLYPQGTNAGAARKLLDRLEEKGWK